MSKYRKRLPQMAEKIFITDGGLETDLIFNEGQDLPCFASFDLLRSVEGCQLLESYYRRYANLAIKNNVGFILESPTWRANANWGNQIGYSKRALHEINQQAIEMMSRLRKEKETPETPMVISGCIGPSDDGYNPKVLMTIEEAQAYHTEQIESFRVTEVDMLNAMTLTYSEEAIGIALAAKDVGLPISLALTVETDGNLPSGQSLAEAIEMIDELTGKYPCYYMINCAHPEHFSSKLLNGGRWIERIRGLRANASNKSHEELDESETLESGDPNELALDYKNLRRYLKNLSVLGGCCGTDHQHVEAICNEFLD